MKGRRAVWYANYPALKEQADAARAAFDARLNALGANRGATLRGFRNELIAQAVQESNWQEGIYLDPQHTREITDIAADWLPDPTAPSLDVASLIAIHREDVKRLVSEGKTVPEIAAFNLSRAHISLELIFFEMGLRSIAGMDRIIERATPKPSAPEALRQRLVEAQDDVKQVRGSAVPLPALFTGSVKTIGELSTALSVANVEELTHPLRPRLIHFLHSVTMMGQLPSSQLGHFRKINVGVGHGKVMFPPHNLVPNFMKDYCRQFSLVGLRDPETDVLWKAAQLSHRFVRIHPYVDGNGRVSRLLMNLVFQSEIMVIRLKADRKGRHRYAQALQRADRGNYDALASLIAMSLRDSYRLMTDALDPLGRARPN